jgi:plasmid stabilization system protein ParE
MNGGFTVRYTDAARNDLVELFDFLLGAAESIEDFDHAQLAIDTLRDEIEQRLARAPFLYRKSSAGSAFQRELIIPFRGRGYVALYDIENAETVTILAVRHQREDDYH